MKIIIYKIGECNYVKKFHCNTSCWIIVYYYQVSNSFNFRI